MARNITPLNDSKIKKAKTEDKTIKLYDGGGLHLQIDKSGKKFWRLDYYRPYTKKRTTIGLGAYPEVSLAEARTKREEIKALLIQDIDPQEQKKKVALEHQEGLSNTFEVVAKEWLSKQNLAESTIKKSESLFAMICEKIGKKPINKITPVDVLNLCRIYEKQEKYETAKKVKIRCSQVFRYGVATGLCERDVTQDLRGALKTPIAEHRAAIVTPAEFSQLIKDMDHYHGSYITSIALKIAPHVFVRPGELRHAKWSDIDLDEGLWSYTPPKTRKKTGVELIVPLSKQVLKLLKDIHPVTYDQSEYIFPAITSNLKPMSENTINQALRRLGYEKEQVSGHGFRASARTMLEEVLQYPIEIIEMQLGHQVRDMHGRAYNRTKHLDKRKEMMQAWSDYLDQLKGL